MIPYEFELGDETPSVYIVYYIRNSRGQDLSL